MQYDKGSCESRDEMKKTTTIGDGGLLYIPCHPTKSDGSLLNGFGHSGVDGDGHMEITVITHLIDDGWMANTTTPTPHVRRP